MSRRLLQERRGVTTGGIRILWQHYDRTSRKAAYYEFTLTCGTWSMESEPDYKRKWTYERAAGFAAGLDYVVGLGCDGAAALVDTVARNAPTEDQGNVVQLFRKPRSD